MQWTDPVVEPRGEARDEWTVIDALAAALGISARPTKDLRRLGRLGRAITPTRLVDLLLRTGPEGDWFGLRRGGLSVAKLRKRPHGVVVDEHIATGVRRRKVRHLGGKVRLDPPEIRAEVDRLIAANGHDPDFPLSLIGLRELRSHNSWMHNAPLLMRGGRTHALRVNPVDAERHELADGELVRVASKSGSLEVPVKITDEMTEGTVALPHGWGHRGGWKVANDAGGANSNLLASSDAADLEPLAGMAFLNGIPVRLEPVRARPSPRPPRPRRPPDVAAATGRSSRRPRGLDVVRQPLAQLAGEHRAPRDRTRDRIDVDVAADSSRDWRRRISRSCRARAGPTGGLSTGIGARPSSETSEMSWATVMRPSSALRTSGDIGSSPHLRTGDSRQRLQAPRRLRPPRETVTRPAATVTVASRRSTIPLSARARTRTR